MLNVFLILPILVIGFANCSKSTVNSVVPIANSLPDFSKLSPSCFALQNSTPILPLNSQFSGAEWNDPHVLKVGSDFVMYASADTNFTKNIKIYRMISQDGKNWSLSPTAAVFQKSASAGAWDSQSVETPAVIFFHGQFYMFYTGYTDQTNSATYKVGYATSPDGIAWTRQSTYWEPENPGGAPDLNFMQYVVGEPAPVVFNDKIYLYFAAQGAHMSVMSTLFTIGLTTSGDGASWSAPQMVLVPDQAIYPRSSYIGYSTPHAQVLNNQIHLFFDVALDPFKQTKIHHAVSSDGVGTWKLDVSAIFDKSQVPWADDQINGPAVFLDGKKLFLWFGGQGNLSAFPNINMGMSLATCEL